MADNSQQKNYLSHGRRVLAVREQNFSGRFLVYELVIPGRITIYPVEGECWQLADEIPLDGNKSSIPYSEGSLPHKNKFVKFKHKDVI
jgi:hypothetical protein